MTARHLDRRPPFGSNDSDLLYSRAMTDRLGNAQAAAVAQVSPSTWRAYVARGTAPEPDGREEISGTPWWWRSTVEDFMRSRPGRGARTDLAS